MESIMLDCNVFAFPGAGGITGLDNTLLACSVGVPFRFGVPGLY